MRSVTVKYTVSYGITVAKKVTIPTTTPIERTTLRWILRKLHPYARRIKITEMRGNYKRTALATPVSEDARTRHILAQKQQKITKLQGELDNA